MASEVVSEEIMTGRGHGSEIVGMRITVYNLIPYFLDPTATEEYISRVYDLTPAQVAAARAYALNNWEEVWAQHLKIEARNAAGNPPEVLKKADELRPLFLKFKEAVARGETIRLRPSSEKSDEGCRTQGIDSVASMMEWLAEQEPYSSPRS